MHDLLLAKEILDTSISYAKQNDLAIIKEIVIELGRIQDHAEEISPENLSEIFSLIAENSMAKDTKLIINTVSGGHWKLISIN